MRILTDIDDTILQFSDAMQKFMASKGYIVDGKIRDQHNIVKSYGISLEETLDYIREFSRSPEMGDLLPEPCAQVVLPELHRQGFEFVAISACVDEPEVFSRRAHNLQRAFGFEWKEIHCMGLTLDKEPVLKAYPPSVWVEDVWHHAVTGAELGHRAFIIDRPHNAGRQHLGVTRVRGWHEIAEIITK